MILLTGCLSVNAQNTDVKNGLKVSGDKHYLVDAKTQQPVFILATTAWNINALTYPEIDTLIQSAAQHGFNSIMFVLDFYTQATEANIYGQKAYVGPDRTELNTDYFVYADYIINKCTQNNLYPMVYTMWSGKTTGIMNTYTPEQLFLLGKRIGAWYQKYKNVILVAGGESSPPYIDTMRVNAMGRGLKEGSNGNNLIAVHPTSPHSSSEFYPQSTWIDFYMCQAKSNLSGVNFDLTKAVTKDYNNKVSLKPTMVAEHRYESGTTEDPVIQRRSLYLSVFAGGFGYAYGHNALWQMTPHTAQPWMMKSWAPGVGSWKQALNTDAIRQLHHIKTLLYAYPYRQRIPNQSLLISGQGDSVSTRVEVMSDGILDKGNATFIIAYLSTNKKITLRTDIIPSGKLNVYWFDPATGLSEVIAKQLINTGTYIADKKPGRQDGVLVIDNADKKYHLPLKAN